jgi:hypothetical protein
VAHEEISFCHSFDGQIQANLSRDLQKGLRQQTVGIEKGGVPPVRSMLLFRFWLPDAESERALPNL